jgi:mono/diheme cytochrome c family protein
MPVNPGGSESNLDGAADNNGPHCRNCHTGASSCQQCHGVNDGLPSWFFGAASSNGKDIDWTVYQTNRAPGSGDVVPQANYIIPASGAGGADTSILSGRLTSYMTQQFIHTSAAANLNGQCVDGGFSFPHRTLGKDLLKDELYGVDFDGSPIKPGEVRGTDASDQAVIAELEGDLKYTSVAGYASKLSEDTTTAVMAFQQGSTALNSGAAVAQNLDSVCLDCHGDASYYNADDARSYTVSGNANGNNQKQFDLLIKGLP